MPIESILGLTFFVVGVILQFSVFCFIGIAISKLKKDVSDTRDAVKDSTKNL